MREQKKRGGMKEGNRERRFRLAVGCNDRYSRASRNSATGSNTQ